MFRFLLPAIFLTAALPLAMAFAFEHDWVSQMPSFLYRSTWLVAFVTTVLFLNLYRVRKPSLFVQLYLLSMVVKLLAALTYCLLIVRQDPVGGLANVVYFLGVYVIFTALEIACLYRRISRHPQA